MNHPNALATHTAAHGYFWKFYHNYKRTMRTKCVEGENYT